MAHKWREIRDKPYSDPEPRERLQQMHQAARLGVALGELRTRRGEAQVELAEKLATSQHNVSRMEHSENPYLSTLREYVPALGGELRIIASFPDGDMLLEPSRAGAGETDVSALDIDVGETAEI